MQINTANLAHLYRGYRVTYNEAYQGCAPVCDPVVLEVPSSTNIEEYDWLGAVPGMKELRGSIQIDNLTAARWTIYNKEWSQAVGVKEKDIENDTYGVYSPLMAAMGLAARQHKDELVFALLAGGFTGLCYTGGAFFSSGQKRAPGDAGFTNNGTAPLGLYSFQTARANIVGRKNSQGRPMGLGRKLVLVVGSALEPVARQIVEQDLIIQAIASGSGATASTSSAATSNVNKGLATVMVSPYLDNFSTTAWFLLEMGIPLKPLIWQMNKTPVLTALTNPDSDHVFKNHEYLYQSYGRYNAGYAYPELAYGSTGQGAIQTTYP